MNRKRYNKKIKKRNNRIAYILRKRKVITTENDVEVTVRDISFYHRGDSYKIFNLLRKRKINVSFSKLVKKIEEINFNFSVYIKDYNQKREELEKEITILKRDWKLNAVIDEN